MDLLTISDQSKCTVQTVHPEERALSVKEIVGRGLGRSPKSLPPILFYDEEGSRLFEKICEVPEYYLTRKEQGILDEYAAEIIETFDMEIDLIELGSGSSTKTRTLLSALFAAGHEVTYRPIDISQKMLLETANGLMEDYENLIIEAIAGDYHSGLAEVGRRQSRQKVFLFLGSNLGNFQHSEALEFLADIRSAMRPGDKLLLGADLVKSPKILEAAYDDSAGVTRAFNLNLLARLNRELGADFNLANFEHKARWDVAAQAIQTYLVSKEQQQVHISALDTTVEFRAGEAMHTESSHKYTLDDLETLATLAGLRLTRTWMDDQGWFALNLIELDPAGNSF